MIADGSRIHPSSSTRTRARLHRLRDDLPSRGIPCAIERPSSSRSVHRLRGKHRRCPTTRRKRAPTRSSPRRPGEPLRLKIALPPPPFTGSSRYGPLAGYTCASAPSFDEVFPVSAATEHVARATRAYPRGPTRVYRSSRRAARIINTTDTLSEPHEQSTGDRTEGARRPYREVARPRRLPAGAASAPSSSSPAPEITDTSPPFGRRERRRRGISFQDSSYRHRGPQDDAPTESSPRQRPRRDSAPEIPGAGARENGDDGRGSPFRYLPST
jgi:hypothetical protein